MQYLQTQSGLVAARYIVRVGGLNSRSTGNYHEVDYVCGREARETRASAEAVADFLQSALKDTSQVLMDLFVHVQEGLELSVDKVAGPPALD
jgi:hypothetical protein